MGDNPNNYATFDIHSSVESYAHAISSLEDMRPRLKSPTLLQDPFNKMIKYLYASNGEVERLYALHKIGAFKKNPVNQEGKEFMLQAVCRGSQMLPNLWYTAYIKSKTE